MLGGPEWFYQGTKTLLLLTLTILLDMMAVRWKILHFIVRSSVNFSKASIVLN